MLFLLCYKIKNNMGKSTHFSGQPLYGQVIKLLDKSKILQISRENGGERYTKRFNIWVHLVVMLYAVIMRFDSLREITASLLGEARKLNLFGKGARRGNRAKSYLATLGFLLLAQPNSNKFGLVFARSSVWRTVLLVRSEHLAERGSSGREVPVEQCVCVCGELADRVLGTGGAGGCCRCQPWRRRKLSEIFIEIHI